jgi:hypothetical protein
VVTICISHCAWPECFEQLFFACHWLLPTVGSSDEVSGEVVVVKSLYYCWWSLNRCETGAFVHGGVCLLFFVCSVLPCLVLSMASWGSVNLSVFLHCENGNFSILWKIFALCWISLDWNHFAGASNGFVLALDCCDIGPSSLAEHQLEQQSQVESLLIVILFQYGMYKDALHRNAILKLI